MEVRRGFVAVGEVAPPVHGATVSFERVLSVLRERGLLVQVVPMPGSESLSSPGRVSLTKLLRGSRALARTVRALSANPGAALYVNSLSPTRLGFIRDGALILAASAMGRRVVCHVHSAPAIAATYDRASPVERRFMRAVGRRVTAAWTLTPGLAKMMERVFPPDRIEVLANASPDWAEAEAGRQRRAEGPIRLLYLSNLVPAKGYPVLLEAMELLGARGVEVELRLVGAVPSEEVSSDLELRIARLPGSVTCAIGGPVEPSQRGEELAWADAFVLPTDYRWEAQPLSIIEAMSASLPILSTRIPGIDESVEDGTEGILVEPRDSRALAEAIGRLATDEEERERIAAAARARYERDYRIETYRERLSSLLDAVVESSPPPHGEALGRELTHPFLVVGPLPPPIDGVSVSTQRVVEILSADGCLAGTIDTTNPRSLGVMGGESHFGPRDVLRGLRQLLALLGALAATPGAGVYMNLSPTRGGLLRDSLLILAAAAFRRDVVVHLHSSEGTVRTFRSLAGPERRLVAAALARVAQAWVLTRSLGESLVPPFAAEQIQVIPNFGDDLALGSTAPQPAQGGPLRLLYFSNLIPSKGYPELLDAVAELGDLEPGLELRLVGAIPGSEVEADLRARLARLPDSVEVEVRGAVPLEGRADEYLWADAFVLPSSYPMEGQPLTILEALSAALPVLSTVHAGIPETVTDGEEAILISPGDSEGLAAAIRRLADDRALVERMSLAARRRYEREFTPDQYSERVRALLGSA